MEQPFRFDRRALSPEIRDLSTWPIVDIFALSEAQRESYTRRRTAVRDYMGGKAVRAITTDLDISRQELLRLAKRCVQLHKDGRIWGERALIPYQHQKKYQRMKPVGRKHADQHGGMAGALSQVFDHYPDVKVVVDEAFLKKMKRGVVTESRMPVKAIHKKMLDSLRLHGIKGNDYPLNATYLGLRALSKYLKALYERKIVQAVRSRDGADAAKLLETGGGNNRGVHADTPYRRVEFDGHRIDAIFIIEIPHPHGGTHTLVLRRLWLLVIVDTHTRAVLGYYISRNSEYTDDDVLECIKRAIVPWSPKSLTIKGLKYREGSGLPSGIFPRCAWACWDELCYDNARANLSEVVTSNLREVIGCAVNAGPVATPTRRPIVESFFDALEENGFHRLPNTTGSHPNDPRRTDPEMQALRYGMHENHLYELGDVLVAEYNATPHTSLGYRSPLEQMNLYAGDPDFPIRILDEDKQNKIGRGVLNIRVRRKVRGSINQGRRPYIELEGARYTSDILAHSPELIGTWLILHVNSEDMRVVTAYLDSGEEFGVISVQGPWSRTAHDLQMRRAINQLRHRKIIFYTESDDPIQVYLQYLTEESVTNTHARGQYARSQEIISNSSTFSAESNGSLKNENSPSRSVPMLQVPILKSRLL